MTDPTISLTDLDVIRGMWPGKIVIKGVQSVDDAKTLASLGVDGIVLSNHGGRQLDRAPIPFHLLPEVARELGKDIEIGLDTGIMSGADIVASIALGADFTMIGRAYLYGLMAGGRAGVDRAIAILADQIVRTMKLLGAASLAELTPSHVTQLERLIPRPALAAAGAAPAPRVATKLPAPTPTPTKAARAGGAAAAGTAAKAPAPRKAPARTRAGGTRASGARATGPS